MKKFFRVNELRKRINQCEEYKKQLHRYEIELALLEAKRKITKLEHNTLLHNWSADKSLEDWHRHYDDYINSCENEIREHHNEKFHFKHTFFALAASLLLLIIFININPVITGKVILSPNMEEANEIVDYIKTTEQFLEFEETYGKAKLKIAYLCSPPYEEEVCQQINMKAKVKDLKLEETDYWYLSFSAGIFVKKHIRFITQTDGTIKLYYDTYYNLIETYKLLLLLHLIQ